MDISLLMTIVNETQKRLPSSWRGQNISHLSQGTLCNTGGRSKNYGGLVCNKRRLLEEEFFAYTMMK